MSDKTSSATVIIPKKKENKPLDASDSSFKDFYLKLKSYRKPKSAFSKRKFDYHFLSDYNKVIDCIKAVINHNEDYSLILVITNSDRKIFIYSDEEWNIYYSNNIITQCIEKNSKTLKIEYQIIDSKHPLDNKIKEMNIHETIINIIQSLPLNWFLDQFILFIKKYKVIGEYLKIFCINNFITNKISKTNIENDNLEENININSIKNNNDKDGNESVNELKDKKKQYEKYMIKGKNFVNILEKKFESMQQYINTIKEMNQIIGDDEENSNTDEKKIFNKSTFVLSHNKKMSLGNNINEDIEENNILNTELNFKENYIKDLLDEKLHFNKYNSDQYYAGIEKFQDDLFKNLYQFYNKK